MSASLMRGRFFALPVILGLLVLLPHAGGPVAQTPLAQEKSAAPADKNYFEKDVLPILKANCVKCHGGDKTRGGLALSNRAALLKGGDNGPALSLKKPEESLLLQLLSHQEHVKMPLGGILTSS